MNNSPERKLRNAKKEKSKYTLAIVALIIAIAAVVAGTVVAVVVNRSSQEIIVELSEEEIEAKVQAIASETNGDDDMIPRIQELFDQQLSITEDIDKKDRLAFMETGAFMRYGYFEPAAEAFEFLSFDRLTDEDMKMDFCVLGSNIYGNLGNIAKSDYYYNLAVENGYVDDEPGEG